MNPLIIIPARLAAQRLPEKPLADIGGRPMINWVVKSALGAGIAPVAVACCDERIQAAVAAEFPEVRTVLTDPHLPSGTDRVHAAAELLDPQGDYDVIINLQGDLPLVAPAVLQDCLKALKNPAVHIGTVASLIEDEASIHNPNVVKIAMVLKDGEESAQALYFSRNAIPANAAAYYHHIGVYAYRRSALRRLVTLPPSRLELMEKLEQLRALEDGMRLDVALTDSTPQSVDSYEDLEVVRAQAQGLS